MTIPFNPQLNHSTDKVLAAQAEYSVVHSVLMDLWSVGFLANAAGNCVSVSELIQKQLHTQGVTARLVEAQLMIQDLQNPQQFQFVGYEQASLNRAEGAVNTHVVVVAESAVPMLIDASIDHLLPLGQHWVITALTAAPVLAQTQAGSKTLTYSRKLVPLLPEITELTVMERIQQQRTQNRALRWLQWISAILALLIVVNTVINLSQLMFRQDVVEHLNSIDQEVTTLKQVHR